MLPNGSAAMPVTARRVERLPSDKGYVPVYTTAVVEQPWQDYGVTDHATWATCIAASVNCWQAAPATNSSPRRMRWAWTRNASRASSR